MLEQLGEAMSPNGEPLSKRALVVFRSNKERRDLERKLLAAAFKLSFEKGDTDGAALAHKGLRSILQSQIYDEDDSTTPVTASSMLKSASEDTPRRPATVQQEPVPGIFAPLPEIPDDQASVSVTPAAESAEAPSISIATPFYSSDNTPSIDVSPAAGPAEASCLSVAPSQEVAAVDSVSVTLPAEAAETAAATEACLPDSKEKEPAVPPATATAPVAPEIAGNYILDPKEVEEAFSLIGKLPPLEAVSWGEYGSDVIATLGHARAGAMVLDGARADSQMGGEITAALERLTAAMPPSAIETATADQKISIHDQPGVGNPPQPPEEVLAQPVTEMPLFEAPRPQLEELPPAPPVIPPNGQAPAAAAEPSATVESTAPQSDAGQGPLSYLDFSDAASPAPAPDVVAGSQEEEPGDELTVSPEFIAELFKQAEAQPQAAGAAPPPVALTPSQLIKTQSFYQILGVNKLSSYEDIHLKFWRLVRRMLQTRHASTMPAHNVREFREVLRHICVAHDILRDPVTRTDYDLRQLGMRKEPPIQEPTNENTPPRTRLMIGELLEIANILDRTELQIALDMHKAEPGTMFGTFLVKAGFLDPEELDSALLGQRLISSGKITVAQFQSSMFRMRDHGTPFFDTLVAEGWLTPSDMLGESSGLWNKGPVPAGTPAEPQSGADAAPKGNGNGNDSAPQTTNQPGAENPSQHPSNNISGEHQAMVAAAKLAEMELLKSLESGDDKKET
jgi:hypothetical protein